MTEEIGLFEIILALVLCLPGLIANLFILSSSILQMRLEVQTVNILMTCDSLNNLALVALIFAVQVALYLRICPTQGSMSNLLFTWEMTSVMQMWGITLICVFYCMKIVPGRVSSWLRRNFSLVVAIFVTVGFTFALVLSFINLYRETVTNTTDPIINNSCPDIELPDWLVPTKTVISSLLHISVFSLMTYSCATLVAHLYSHVRRMRGNQPDMSGAKHKGVTSVAIMIFLLAVEFGCCTNARLLLIFLASEVISISLISDLCTVSLVLCSLIPSTLIAGTSSLRENATSCCLKAKYICCRANFPGKKSCANCSKKHIPGAQC